jgi:hypothetical protein
MTAAPQDECGHTNIHASELLRTLHKIKSKCKIGAHIFFIYPLLSVGIS